MDFSYSIAQVSNRLTEAKSRCDRHMRLALDATSRADYDKHLDEAIHAARDYETWKKVYDYMQQDS